MAKPKTAPIRINTTIDAATLRILDRIVKSWGTTRSAALRRIIRESVAS